MTHFQSNRLKNRLDMLYNRERFIAVPKPTVKWGDSQKWSYDPSRFSPDLRLRTVLDGEIVVEYDGIERNESIKNITLTCGRLREAGYTYEVFDHGGVSPHIHLYIPELVNLPQDRRQEYKRLFLDKYAKDFIHADMSLTGIHLIALEFAPHWKTKYNGAIKERIEIHDTLTTNKIEDELVKKTEITSPKKELDIEYTPRARYSKGIEDIIDMTKFNKASNGEFYGPHPAHGSSTGENFWLNTKMQCWHCFRHNSGGGIMELIGVLEGIIKCEDCKKGVWDE